MATKAKPQPVEPQTTSLQDMEDRGVWGSISLIFSAIANTLVGYSQAAGKSAIMLDELAEAGVIMASSNRRIVGMKTIGKEQHEVDKLIEKYPEADFSNL